MTSGPRNSGSSTIVDFIGLQHVDVQLTNTQIKNLHASPVTLIANPGDGYMILPIRYRGVADFLSGAYTDGGGCTATFSPYSSSSITSSLFTLGDLLAVAGDFAASLFDTTTLSLLNNQPLLLGNDSVFEWADGHASNTLSLRIWYSIVPTVPFGG